MKFVSVKTQEELKSLLDLESRLERCTQILQGATPFSSQELRTAAKSFYEKLVAADAYTPQGVYNGSITLFKAQDNYVSVGRDYGLSSVSIVA